METGAKALEWLRNAVLGLFVAALLAGIFLPIYTDEIGWRLQSRAAFDGVDKLYTELCGPNTLAHPPFWMLPTRYYSAVFNGLFPDPLFVRLSGILYALVWTVLVVLLIRRVADRAHDRVALSTLAIGFMSLGVMPLLLVVSRPEQPILLAMTGALLVVATGWKRDGAETAPATAWRRSLTILLLALVAMSYHVKAVAAAPLFLVCIALAARGAGTLAPRIVAGALLVVAGAWAAHYWVDRFACPADARVRADFLHNTGAALVNVHDASQVLPMVRKLLSNVSVLLYAGLPAPRWNPMAYWVPFGRISAADSFAWFLALAALWTLALIAAAYCLLLAARQGWRERRPDGRIVLAVTLMATVLGWSALGFTAVYEATFALPMMMFAVVLAFSTHDGSVRFVRGIGALAAGVGLMGIVSIALVAGIYGPSFAAAAQQRGYVAGQPYSISPFGFAEQRRDILAVASKCGITQASSKLVIDDLSYFPLMRTHLPQHRGGLFLPLTSQDPMEYLRSIRSDGIIASCHVLPPALRVKAKREGSFCCVAPADFQAGSCPTTAPIASRP